MKPQALIITEIESVVRNLSHILRAYGIDVKTDKDGGESVNYVLAVLGPHDELPSLNAFSKAKKVIALPIYRREFFADRERPDVKMVYYHELVDCDALSPRVGYANWMISMTKIRGGFSLPKEDFQIYPVEVPDLCQALVRASLSYFDKKSLFIASSVSFYGFSDWIRLAWPDASVARDAGFELPKVEVSLAGLDVSTPALSTAKLQNLVLNSRVLSSTQITPQTTEKKERTLPRLNLEITLPRPKISGLKFARALAVASMVLLAPIILSAISLGSLFLGERVSSRMLFAISQKTSVVAEKFIPEGKLKNTLSVVAGSSDLSGRVLGTADGAELESYDYESVYVASSFLEAEARASDIYFRDKILGLSVFEIPRDDVLRRAEIEKYLPRIMGEDSERTYLVLFEDFGFARPQGGKVMGAKLYSVYQGGVTENAYYTQAQIQTLLAGQIDPPEAMKDYAGIDSWRFEDLEWATDFSAVAERAEWFIDHSLDRRVDGVFSVDLEILKALALEERDFDPIKEIDSLVYYLDSGRVKLYFNDPYLESFAESQGWAGEPSKFGNYFYIYDSQLSEEKNSIYREAFLEITGENSETHYKLTLKFENKSSDPYESYARLVVDPESYFTESAIDGKPVAVESILLGRKKEGGVYLYVPAGGESLVEFSWVNEKSAPFIVGTQASVAALPLSIKLNLTNRPDMAYNTVLENSRVFTIE